MNKRNGRASSATTHQISRRAALKLFTSVPVAAAAVMSWTPLEAERARERTQTAARQAATQGTPFTPAFFTAHEYATVVILVDLIIPKDDRSGSATDAGVPAFMDFMMTDQPRRQIAMRGGLALIDHMCEERFDKMFVDCTDAQRHEILDDIAFTGRVTPAHRQAAAFFGSFRDLTASGFWTTKMGIDDLGYQGNTFVGTWKGCPDAALKKLGVAYGPDRE